MSGLWKTRIANSREWQIVRVVRIGANSTNNGQKSPLELSADLDSLKLTSRTLMARIEQAQKFYFADILSPSQVVVLSSGQYLL